jgi:hypothetical protein
MKIIFMILWLLFPALAFAQEKSDSNENWMVKTNLALTVQGGAIINVLDPQPAHVFEGYFVRLGGKKYLFQKNREIANSGLAVKAEVHYSHWRDWYTNMRGNFGNRWENSIGGLVTVSYSHLFGNTFFIEPYVGLGYIPTWQNSIHANDIEPFQNIEVNWWKITPPERRFSYFSHLWITSNFVFSPGINVGLRF